MSKKLVLTLSLFILLVLIINISFAQVFPLTKVHIMPPHEKLIEKKVKLPKLPEITPQNIPQGTKIYGTIEKAQGIGKAIVIPVEFTDKPRQPEDIIPSNYFDILFNSVKADWSNINPYNVGSVREFYLENSYGQFDITATVLPWYTAQNTYSYYINDGNNGFNGGVFVLVKEVLQHAVDIGYDLRNYDVVFVIHSGQGADWTGDPNDIWSHASTVYVNIGGKNVPIRYSIEPEYMEDHDTQGNPVIIPQTVGVFVHEMGHSFGHLPDLYDRDYSSWGLGSWSLMAAGSWNGPQDPGGHSMGGGPSHFDAWSKIQLGWITPTVPTNDLTNVNIPPVETNPVVYKLWTDGAEGPQYFLIENRQPIGFDKYLRGFGLLIYHVDENMRNFQNDNEWYPGLDPSRHYLVALEQADGKWDLEKKINSGDAGDPYPGSTNNTTFDEKSTPNSNAYGEIPTGVAVKNITASEENIICDIYVKSLSAPQTTSFVKHLAWTGENPLTIRPLFKWKPIPYTVNYTLQVATDSNFNSIIINVSTEKNEYRPTLEESLEPGKTYFARVRAENASGVSPWTTISFTTPNTFEALLVSDDGGEFGIAPYFEKALQDINVSYFIVDVFYDNAVPPASFMSNFDWVIWGGDWGAIYDPSVQNEIMNYLDNGGKLFISSQDLGWGYSAGYISSTFYNTYLRAEFVQDDVGIYSIKGANGSEFESLSLSLNTEDSAQNQGYPDEIDPLEGARTILVYTPSGISPITPNIKLPEKIKEQKSIIINKEIASSGTAGIFYADPTKHYGVVYFAFGLEGLSPNISGEVLSRVRYALFSSPEITTTVTQSFNPNNNENCSIKLTVKDNIGYSYLTVKIYSTLNNRKKDLVKTLADNTKVDNGTYELTWDGKDENGKVNPGRYMVEVFAKDELNNSITKTYYTTIPYGVPLSFIDVTKFSKAFNPNKEFAQIMFTLTQDAHVKFIVYSLTGVKLYERDLGYLPAGEYSIVWEGVNLKGEILKNGLYVFQLVATSSQGEARINRFIGILK
ncbi:MAG: M6 family metalloprotease domain-containing protein [Dictyoglomus sp.]